MKEQNYEIEFNGTNYIVTIDQQNLILGFITGVIRWLKFKPTCQAPKIFSSEECSHYVFIYLKQYTLSEMDLAGSTFRWERQFWRKMCQLLRKNCFWLTHSKHVTRGYKAWGDTEQCQHQEVMLMKDWVCCGQCTCWQNAEKVKQLLS